MHGSESKSKTAAGSNPNPHHVMDWRVYAAAAGATLAMTANADASIVYSNFAGQPGSNAAGVISILPLPEGGPTFFRLGPALSAVAVVDRAQLLSEGVFGGEAALQHAPRTTYRARGIHPYFFTGKLNAGDPVGGGVLSGFSHPPYADILRLHSRSIAYGPFGPGTVTGFVGFELTYSSHSRVDYRADLGWLRVRVSDKRTPGYPNELQLIDYAYNDTGGPIVAGQISDVPEPGTAALALLATGAAGLVAWRKRRSEASPELDAA